MILGPGQCECAAAQGHNDDRLAGCTQRLQQVLLRCRKIDAGAVSAAKAFDLDRHLLALQLRRETHEGEDDIGRLRGRHGFIDLRLRRSLPVQGHSASRHIARVAVLQPEVVRVGVGET